MTNLEQTPPLGARTAGSALRDRVRRLDASSLLGWPLTLALLALILDPLGTMLRRTFVVGGSLNLQPLRDLADDPAFTKSVENTLIIIGTAGTFAIILGALFAWLNERTDASFGFVSRLAPLIPLLIPPVCLAVGWIFVAQPAVGFLNYYLREGLGHVGIHMTQGPFNISTFPGLVFVYTIALVPYAYIVIAPALRNMDTSLEEASRMTGAGPLRTALRVSLPAIMPAIASAALLVVIIAASLYSIPAIIGTTARIETVSVYIVYLTQNSSAGFDQSVAVALVLAVFVLAVWLLHGWVTRRQRHVTISGKATTHTVIRLGRWKWVARGLLLAYLLCVSVLPFLALLVVALQPFWQPHIDVHALTLHGFRNFFSASSSIGRHGLIDSLKLAAVASTAIMVAASILVTYAHRVGGRTSKLISVTTKIPAAISGLVVAVAILLTFAGPPFRLHGSLLILLLAYLVVFMPQASIAAEVARGQVGGDLLEAASMVGVSRLRSTFGVLWPLMRPGLAYGWALIFVLVMGDLEIAAILSGPGNPVVGTAFAAIFMSGIYSDLASLGTIVAVITLVVVGLVTALYGRPSRRKDRALPGWPGSRR
jgi:iron(III) transport system permease protein